MDKLIVKGIPSLNGEYEFDIAGLMTTGHPESMTSRELHRVKVMSGVRAGELAESFSAGDSDLLVAIAAIVLTRAGKRVDEDLLWDAPAGSGLDFDIEQRADDEEDGEAELPPPPAPPLSEPSATLEPSGGGSGKTISEPLQENDPRATGLPGSERSADSDPAISAI